MAYEMANSFRNIGSAVTSTRVIRSSCMKAILFIAWRGPRDGTCARTMERHCRDAIWIPSQTASANDAVVAEVNKQRIATRAFTEQTATLNQKLGELGEAVGQTQEIAKQNVELKRDVSALRQQLSALDTQLRDRKSPASSPSPSPDDKW